MSSIVHYQTSKHILGASWFVLTFRGHFHEFLEIEFWRQEIPQLRQLVPRHLAVDVWILETQSIDCWQFEQPLLLNLEGYVAVSAKLLFRGVLYSEVAFTFDDLLKYFFDVPLGRWQLAPNMHHFPDIVLVIETSLCFCNVIYSIALSATLQVDGHYTKSGMCCTLWSAPHIVQSVIHRPLLVTVRFHIFLKIVWINTFSVQKAQNSLKCLLGTAHIFLDVGFSGHTSKVQFSQRLSHIFGINDSIVVTACFWKLALVLGIF